MESTTGTLGRDTLVFYRTPFRARLWSTSTPAAIPQFAIR